MSEPQIHPDIKLNDPEAFEERFIEYTSRADTYEEAYMMAEQDYHQVFKRRKYSGYNSFRVSRTNRIKRKRRQA